eukprot:2963554-Rhodomonas_salina.2
MNIWISDNPDILLISLTSSLHAVFDYTTICLNVTQSNAHAKGAAVDSASPIDIQNDHGQANLTFGDSVFLEGIRKGSLEVPSTKCVFPTVDCYGNAVVLETKRKGILFYAATSKVISLAALLHSGHKVHFEVGRPGDHQYGGTITVQDGTVIMMLFVKGI